MKFFKEKTVDNLKNIDSIKELTNEEVRSIFGGTCAHERTKSADEKGGSTEKRDRHNGGRYATARIIGHITGASVGGSCSW